MTPFHGGALVKADQRQKGGKAEPPSLRLRTLEDGGRKQLSDTWHPDGEVRRFIWELIKFIQHRLRVALRRSEAEWAEAVS
jgi:hypothetical protein